MTEPPESAEAVRWSLRARLRAASRLAVVCGAIAACSTLSVAGLARAFDFGPWVLPAHVLFVAGLLSNAVLGGAVICSLWPRGDRILVLPLLAATATLALVHAANWVGYAFWAESVSAEMILSYLASGTRMASDAGVPRPVVGAAVATLVAAFAWAVVLALRRRAAVVSGVRAVAGSRRGRRGIAWSTTALLVHSAAFAGTYWTAKDMSRLQGEPLLGLFPDRGIADMREAQVPAALTGLRHRPASPAASSAGPANVARKNVVLVVLDAVRADHLALHGYHRDTAPTLSALASSGPALVAEWATASCSISGCGIVALLGSRTFSRTVAEFTTLPDVLLDAGYDTYYLLSGDFSRGFPVMRRLFGPGARVFRDGWRSTTFGVWDDRVVLEALDDVPPFTGRPAFFYVHLHSAHGIGVRFQPPRFGSASEPVLPWHEKLRRHVFKDFVPALPANRSTDHYDNGVAQADAVMGDVLTALDRKGYLRDSILVVTADHGEALGEHGDFDHGSNLFAESIDIPLVIRDTGFAASRSMAYARQIDVAPTVAALAGLDAPGEWEGSSLLEDSPTLSFHQTTQRRPVQAVVWRNGSRAFKYLRDTRQGTERLFELTADPGERNDVLASAAPDVLEFLRRAADGYFPTLPVPR